MFVLHEVSKYRGGRVCASYETKEIGERAISCLCEENKYSDEFTYLLVSQSGFIFFYSHCGVLR